MKVLFLSFLLGFCAFSLAEDENYSVIENPAISKRCKALIDDRNNKILFTQNLKSLVKRNKSLQKKLRANQRTLEQKLLIHANTLRRELTLALAQIQNMEEKIIRSGCPGMTL